MFLKNVVTTAINKRHALFERFNEDAEKGTLTPMKKAPKREPFVISVGDLFLIGHLQKFYSSYII